MTAIPIVIYALRTVTKGFVKRLEDLEIRGQVETFQTAALLRSALILRRVQEFEETSCLWNFSEKLLANTGVENS